MTYEEWRDFTRYGRRWKVECAYSAFKRTVGENVSAITRLGMAAQAFAKVTVHNLHCNMRANTVGITGNEVYVADV